ncbi:MAG: F0F1 ATP synthase subunit delta [Gammaproteobacteria bacterium]
MELSWSTFILEIINFLVLVWILKRFLYQPVLDVIAARRKSIEEQLSEAHTVEHEAEALKEQYNGRLAQWESERRNARDELEREIEQERARQLEELRSTLESEREKSRVTNERELAEQRRELEQQALRQGAAFASRLLTKASGPELENRLLELFVDGLKDLSEDQLDRLREHCADKSAEIEVSSAWPLSDEQRERLSSALTDALGASPPVRFGQDEQLLAGLRVEMGAWVLAVNVRDELAGFTELSVAAS